MQKPKTRAARAIAALGDENRHGRASSPDATYLHVRSAGHRHDVFEPFTPEQQALVDWLTERQADKSLCDAAWDAFARLGPLN